MSDIAAILTVIIYIVLCLIFFALSVKKVKKDVEKRYIITCYKSVMYFVVAVFTLIGFIANQQNSMFLSAAIVTVSIIEATDNWFISKQLKEKI